MSFNEYGQALGIENNTNEKPKRLIELENNPEFKKLSYTEQMILVAGEKLLDMDTKLKSQTYKINNLLSQYGTAIHTIYNNQKDFSKHVNDIVKKEAINIASQIENGSPINSIDDSKIKEIIDEKYIEGMNQIENRIEYTAKQTMKNLDDSINETIDRIDQIKQFEMQAREEIQKNQDRIYVLEEEITRQKEVNESLKNSIEYWSSNSQDILFDEKNSSIINYKYFDSRFETIDDLEEYIKQEAKTIAKSEVEKYINTYNLFEEDRKENLIEKLFDEDKLKESELSKLYSIQINNNSRMAELENLMQKQNEQIKLLSEDRQILLETMSNIIKNETAKPSEISKIFLNEIENNNINNNDVNLNNNINKLLNNNEMELLIKKQAIELVKKKIDLLNNSSNIENTNNKIINTQQSEHLPINNNINNQYTNKHENDVNGVFLEEVNFHQDNLNNSYVDQNIKNRNNINSNINLSEINFNELDIMDDEEFMKHNYYNSTMNIPGTKITRINNYKLNNDANVQDLNLDAQNLIKKDIEEYEKKLEITIDQKDSIFDFNNDLVWQENNQKLVDLENLISKQDEEIRKIREEAKLEKIIRTNNTYSNDFVVDNNPITNYNKNTASETKVNNEIFTHNYVEPQVIKQQEIKLNSVDSSTLNDIDESIKIALSKLNDLSYIQGKTQKDIEETNKKIFELESQLKNNSIHETCNNEISKLELSKMIDEKYKSNVEIYRQNYLDEMKKIESERRLIEETLELERIRVLSEIEANKKRIEQLQQQQQQKLQNQNNNTMVDEIHEKLDVIKNELVNKTITETKNEHDATNVVEQTEQSIPTKNDDVKIVLEAPKKKRKQQIFYEIKIHSTPKLTRADLEK